MKPSKNINRRQFIGSTAAAAAAFTIVPRHVIGGPGFIPSSDKINLGYIGCGIQGLREMAGLIKNPAIQIITVCDPNKFTENYVDWSKDGLINDIREVLEDPVWGKNIKGIPGGRDIGKELVEKYYAKNSSSGKFKGCTSYTDFRELLEKEKGIDAVKIMTPDHLHATISLAAMKKGKHVVIHKPIANRIYEARLVIETTQKTGLMTHLLAWSKRTGYDMVLDWIRKGAIGTLKEVHNWTNRPVWPQWTANPIDKPPIPEGFEWDLWLGCVPDRPYHPNYTHAVFRGWYDFGAGSIADMGTYSLWPLFTTFAITEPPVSAEAYGTTTCEITDQVSRPHKNDVAFPYSCMIRFKLPPQGHWGPIDLFWYDGGMKPPAPEELLSDNEEFTREGMMFVGDQGKILAGFHCDNPRIIPAKKMNEFLGTAVRPEDTVDRNENVWINSMLTGKQSPGSFLNAGAVTETILLGAVALQAGKRIEYDAESMKVTNDEEANKFLFREYRPGWEL